MNIIVSISTKQQAKIASTGSSNSSYIIWWFCLINHLSITTISTDVFLISELGLQLQWFHSSSFNLTFISLKKRLSVRNDKRYILKSFISLSRASESLIYNFIWQDEAWNRNGCWIIKPVFRGSARPVCPRRRLGLWNDCQQLWRCSSCFHTPAKCLLVQRLFVHSHFSIMSVQLCRSPCCRRAEVWSADLLAACCTLLLMTSPRALQIATQQHSCGRKQDSSRKSLCVDLFFLLEPAGPVRLSSQTRCVQETRSSLQGEGLGSSDSPTVWCQTCVTGSDEVGPAATPQRSRFL